jgi:cytochrome P450
VKVRTAIEHRRVPTLEDLSERSCQYLLDYQHRRNPFDFLREMREVEPVHQSDTGTWIIADYGMAMDALRDDRLSRGAAGYETTMDQQSTSFEVDW